MAVEAPRETIFALSTPPGRSGIAVIRVSGPAAGVALEAVTGAGRPTPRLARLVSFSDPESGEPIDRGLALWFPAPGSFTGEDVAELHLHGGRAVVAAMVDGLGRLPGLRPAEAGEFTRRAFDNDKLDLAEVEGLADLIAAETEAQRRQALRQMDGGLSRTVEAWRGRLVRALAHIEAEIDFPEEDIPAGLVEQVRSEVRALETALAETLDDRGCGERLREGLLVAIVGAPNVGKSSLLNALARRDVAIVSETAGTTRDVIEVHLDLKGWPVILADTAGLRRVAEGSDPSLQRQVDPVEREGIRRARARAAAADLKIAVFDAVSWPNLDGETAGLLDENSLILVNKMDLVPEAERSSLGRAAGNGGLKREGIGTSARTGAGLQRVIDRLGEMAEERLGVAGVDVRVTRARHRAALEDCRAALERAAAVSSLELAAEDLRLAARALGRIAGRVDVEELLDVIFRDFCIGK